MEFNKKDQIEFKKDKVIHQSAGGFVFYEDSRTHILYVALLKKRNGDYLIPKGHLQKNEKDGNAALREIKEELNFNGDLEKISKIGVDNYSFKLSNDNREHYKNVHLYVYNSPKKEKISPLKEEDFVSADWLEFHDALEKITFDKDNLLSARQLFYYNKEIKNFSSINEIKSIFIGIPTRDGAKTIILALESIFKALNKLPNHINKKIVICFDHCQDNTEKVVKDFLKEQKDSDLNINLIKNNDEPGKANSLNLLFNESNADLLCFIDDDIELEKDCILNLIEEIIKNKQIRCVYARWIRKKLQTKNIINKFWHWLLGVKFDVQPYEQPSEFMRGPCMMFRSENFVYLPQDYVLNDDQYIQYFYWPQTKEVQDAILYFHSVCSFSDYYKRFIRITAGAKQLDKEFSKERISKCHKDLYRKLDNKKIKKFPLKYKLPFKLYLFLRFFMNKYVKFKLKYNKNYEWERIKQG